ncbi:MAG: ABC transporter permease [Gemmatimonadetes bacterium]|nr:ABC transporter permease [Gemmatimonadota bacterium]
MPELGRFARELRARLWKPAVEDEVASEMAYHMEMLEQDLVAQGVSPADARAQARARFGSVDRVAAECVAEGEARDTERRRFEWRAELSQDLRQGWRQLANAPRFAFVTISTLAVGLGAATIIYAIAHAVMLRPLPFPDADRLLLISERNPSGQEFAISESNFLDWQARTTSFSSAAIFEARRMAMRTERGPEGVRGAVATHTLFPTLGVGAALGRTFLPEEDRRGGDVRVAVISHGLWERQFSSDRGIVGRSIDLDGRSHRIVGVMPAGFDFPGRTDVWLPLVPIPEYPRGDHRNEGVARLKAGVTMSQARQELEGVAAQLATEYEDNRGWSAAVRPFREWYVSPQLNARMLVLLSTVALLLGMACVNVANLLLARAATREREMAVRAALGAGRWRMVRQLLTESLLLSAIGAAGGIALAAALVPIIRATGSEAIPRLAGLVIDWRVLAVAIPICVGTGVLFGLAPAARLLRGARAGDRVHDLLRSGTRVADAGRSRQALIVMSVAFATILLVGAGLVGTSFRRLMSVDPGFVPSRVVVANVTLPDSAYDEERAIVYVEEATRRLRALPGVRAAGATNLVPFSGGNTAMDFAAAERATAEKEGYRSGSWRVVTPGYFQTVGIPLLRGRAFSGEDRFREDTNDATDRVVIVNDLLADAAWPGRDPIGQRLALSNGATMTVIGVVGATRHLTLDSLPRPTMYFAHAQFPWKSMWFTVTTEGDPTQVGAAMRRELQAMDGTLPVTELQPMETLVRLQAAEPRLTAMVFGIFAVAALVLVAVGLYGIVAYSVSQRTREIGVSMALGAAPAQVVRQVMSSGLRLGALGVAIGGVLSLGVAGALRSILYDTQPTEVGTYAIVGFVLLAVTVAASAVPAWRAARLDPVQALRSS